MLRLIRAASLPSWDRALDGLRRSAAEISRSDLNAIMSTLRDAQREVIATIAESDWSLGRRAEILRRIDAAMREVREQLRLDLDRAQVRDFNRAESHADNLLTGFGGKQERLWYPLNRQALAGLRSLAHDFISDVTDETRKRIDRAITQGIVQGKSPQAVIEEIGKTLVSRDREPADNVWGKALARAETIYRTETNRAFDYATDARLAQHDEARPGLMKIWIHSGQPNARPSHERAGEDYGEDGEPIPVGDDFVLHVGGDEAKGKLARGSYRCRFPRDLRLPVGLVANCRCSYSPWRPSFAEEEIAA